MEKDVPLEFTSIYTQNRQGSIQEKNRASESKAHRTHTHTHTHNENLSAWNTNGGNDGALRRLLTPTKNRNGAQIDAGRCSGTEQSAEQKWKNQTIPTH